MRALNGKAMRATYWVVSLLFVGRTQAGNLDPTNGPEPTMHTLEEIYQKVAVNQALSPSNSLVLPGNYALTNLAEVDLDLTAANIKRGVNLFGVVGTYEGDTNVTAAIPRTGLTTSYAVDDDGALQRGVAWPSPRFKIAENTNVVVDSLTGLTWARNAGLLGVCNWGAAVTNCNDLDYGGYTDWRLPNGRELHSLITWKYSNPALCNTDGSGPWTENTPFTDVFADFYWSSTVVADHSDRAWSVSFYDGSVSAEDGTNLYSVWPVRGGFDGPISDLEVSPASATLNNFGDTVNLTASGGIPPYYWSVDNISLGNLSASAGTTVTYTRSFSGDNIVRVTDSSMRTNAVMINQP